MKFGLFSTCAALALATASAASAGGYIAPQVEPEVVAPIVPVTPVGNWQGAYGGVSLGYAFGGKDDFGFDYGEGEVPSQGKLKLKGINGDLHVGYRWQRDRWVFGPELSIMGGDIKDNFDFAAGTVVTPDVGLPVALGGAEAESKVNSVAALKLKTGYEVQPNTLVFGTLGVARGDFTYTVAGDDFDYKSNGVVFGLGFERMVNDRMSLVAEIERNQFDKKEVDLYPGVTTNASPSFNNVKVGVNFRF